VLTTVHQRLSWFVSTNGDAVRMVLAVHIGAIPTKPQTNDHCRLSGSGVDPLPSSYARLMRSG
jgi:hypothetical protein